MQVRCPYCHTPIETQADDPLTDVECPSCGSHFSLVSGQSTVSQHGGKPRTVAHFQLIEQVGVGRYGSVWKARDTQLDRTVAVKIPRLGRLDSTETEQFLREARAAAQVKHPSIVAVHEVGRLDDSVYIVSDFIDGASLSEWLSTRRLTVQEAVTLCIKIAEALHVAHEAGVVHRDLKPGNIMMDADGEPHVADFGLAKREAGEVTMTVDGRILGTPAYMPPEQARGEAHQADRRADIYSLGVVLYELLTGHLPFRGEVRMLIMQILHDEPTPPRKLNGRIPRDLETICLKCLEKEPRRRYETASQVAEELHRVLKGEPIRALPVSAAGRFWRFFRRDPGSAMVPFFFAAAFTALILSAVIWRGLEVRERRLVGADFELEALGKVRAIEQRLRNSVEIIYSLTAFYAASQEVEPDEFYEFTQPVLSRCEEIQALAWVPRIAATEEADVQAQRAVHEERVRRQGNKNRDYQITELSEAGFVAAPERDEYFPVCFVAPYEANRPVAGFNLASEPARREVFERLIKSGEPVAVSGRVPPLVEEDAGTALMVVGPIYRKSSPLDTPDQRRENLIGFVVNEVRVDVVVERALWNDGAVDIRMQVFDEFAVPGPTLLHTYPPDSGQAGALAAGHSQAPAIAGPFFKDVLTVPGRNWSVHCWPTEQYTILRKPWLPPVASLVIGLLFAATLLVSGLLLRARPR